MSDDWKIILDAELKDSLQMEDDDSDRVEIIDLNQEMITQFIKFEVLSWYGHRGGLQFFQIV